MLGAGAGWLLLMGAGRIANRWRTVMACALPLILVTALYGRFDFACLGGAFMLIEVALLRRFVLLLGHPVYSLTVSCSRCSSAPASAAC